MNSLMLAPAAPVIAIRSQVVEIAFIHRQDQVEIIQVLARYLAGAAVATGCIRGLTPHAGSAESGASPT